MKANKKVIALIIASCMILSATSVVFADNITNVITAVINKVTILFDAAGSKNADEAGQQMGNTAGSTKQTIDSIVNSADADIQKQLEEYKNSQINKKNQEINTIINELKINIDQKKQQKLDQYKQKIDEKINSEYDKLIKDLTK